MNRFERWAIWVSSLATALTGLVLLVMKYFLEPADQWSVINHPLQPLVLKLHILAGPLLVCALGIITMRHVWEQLGLRVRRGFGSGLTAAAMAGAMILTGYLIQVVTHEWWLRLVALAHIAAGVIYVVGLVAHRLVLGRQESNGANGAVGGPPVRRGLPIAGPAPRAPEQRSTRYPARG